MTTNLSTDDIEALRALLKKLGPACDLHVIHGNEVVDEDGEEVAYAASGPRADERAEFIAESYNAFESLLHMAEEALRLREVICHAKHCLAMGEAESAETSLEEALQ